MIILDTNTVSETLKSKPSEIVLNWLAAQQPYEIFITVITQAELLYGVESLPVGKRRLDLSHEVEKLFSEDFPSRILPFDESSARMYARIASQRKSIGRPLSQSDAMIAAIARGRNAAVATRNMHDFEECGIRVINPWTERRPT
jgi:predicted nucleic acid-binding protein